MVVPNNIEDPEKLSLICQLVDLTTSLRQERLFVISEQNHLQQLNINVNKSWYDLKKLVWVTWQQRICVNKLSVTHCDFSPASCCASIATLENTEFEEAHKILSYQSNLHCTQLLNFLKQRPQLIAHCLSVINQTQSDFLTAVVESIILGLYGCCLLPEDKASVLELLLHLTHLQLVPAEDPLRLLRHGSCAFARLYSLFHEGLYSATLFLTAALHTPMMHLLMEDEKFLDIDPDKALIRFAAAERLKMFGAEGSPEYKTRLQKYRLWTINKLVSITNKFIDNIKAHIHCFPSSICWLVRHIYNLLVSARKLEEKQIFSLCVDLVITFFICPAIVNPESYGIIDAPVSYIARFNLIQVAKILQTLAMRKYEPVEPKVADLYKHFEEDCLSSIINTLLENALSSTELDKEPSNLESNDQLKQMAHNVTAFFTEQQLHNLIIFLQSATNNELLPKKEKTRLDELLSAVATDFSPVPNTCSSSNSSSSSSNNNNNNSNTVTKNVNGDSSPMTLAKRQINIISKAVNRTKMSAAAVASSVLNTDYEIDNISNNVPNFTGNKDLETVLVFSLEDDNEIGIIGLLTEQQVLEGENCNIIENGVCDTLINVNNCVEPPTSQTKTLSTCCSSQDGEEVVSEAGSNESEDSSIDLEAEDQNDNLSDMISANVSGRGTPNISGRDTPSSQIMENENEEPNAMERAVPPPPPSQAKQPRFDLDDKFGKFEIKNLPHSGDETVSLVSDTWSTDVLASDSENIEQNQSNNSANASSVFSSSDALAMFQNANFGLVDISETASEGWSTDVVVSDSDRVTEVDTDDTASMARSDITTRSEVESRGEGADVNAEDVPTTSNPTPSHVMFQKEESGNLIHVIGSAELLDNPTVPVSETSTRSNLANLSRSSTSSQSRSSSSHQASMDSEDIRVTGGDVASVSISSAASVSSSCSSAGIAENDNVQNKQFTFSEHVSSNQIVSLTSNMSTVTITTTSSSSVSVANGCAVTLASEKNTKSSTVIKSISFDKTAEKGDKDDDRNKQRSGFFKNFKLAFKNRRGRDNASQWDESTSGSLAVQYNNNVKMMQELNAKMKVNNRTDSNNKPKSAAVSRTVFYTNTSDDILAKYRTKQTNGASTSAAAVAAESESKNIENRPNEDSNISQNEESNKPELNIHSETFMFENAKKKLRYVLSNAEIQQLPCTSNDLRSLKEAWCQKHNVLVAFLQLQLAEAIHLKDRALTAHLHETVRCVKSFDDQKCGYLLDILKKEYKARAPYLSYLMRCRQTLLSITAHLNRLMKRIKCEQEVCKNFFASICVRIFLQKKEQQLLQFATEFHNLTLADEKNDLLRNFLSTLEKQVDNDVMWQGVSDQQLEAIKAAIERSVISRVYMYAMFPNGDGDISRDEVLHEHIKKLSKIITPNHKDLCIPKKYHYECPWPAAQEELIAMSAYKIPAEKLGCILRCTQTIQNLLCLACNNSVPSADSLVPVLVYVIIMANPPSLLSTIQYINSFYGTRLQGEEQYWWVQFCSAVEYIKTMDYTS